MKGEICHAPKWVCVVMCAAIIGAVLSFAGCSAEVAANTGHSVSPLTPGLPQAPVTPALPGTPALPLVFAGGIVSNPEKLFSCAVCWTDGHFAVLGDLGFESEVTCTAYHNGSVYMGGYMKTAGDREIAGYWLDGYWTPLTGGPTGNARVYDIVVDSDGTVYAGGSNAAAENPDLPFAGYWKNGSWVQLKAEDGGSGFGRAQSIAIENGHVYAAGYTVASEWANELAGYWKDGEWNLLEKEDFTSGVLSICVRDGRVLCAGYRSQDLIDAQYGYWDNGEWKLLVACRMNAAAARHITVDDLGNIYTTGYTRFGSIRKAVYWKNTETEPVRVSDAVEKSDAVLLCFDSAGKIVVFGNQLSDDNVTFAGYWKDGTWYPLSSGAGDAFISSAVQADGIFHVGGCVTVEPGIIPVIYSNGSRFFLEPGLGIGNVKCITVRDNTVWAGGSLYLEGSSSKQIPCLWKDGKPELLGETAGVDASVNSIAFTPDGKMIAGGSVIDSGMSLAVCWYGTERLVFDSGSDPCVVTSIAVADGKLYASGIHEDEQAGVWVKDLSDPLDTGGWTLLSGTADRAITAGIAVMDGNVYISGRMDGRPGWWENGTWNPIDLNNAPEIYGRYEVAGIAVDNSGSVYVGCTVRKGHANTGESGYWKDGVWIQLTDMGMVKDVVLHGSDIYACGCTPGTDRMYSAGYWKNGEWTAVSSGLQSECLTSIFLL